MRLEQNKVWIRWIATETVAPRFLARLARLLDPEECARAARFRRPEDRVNYICAHALLRGILADLTGRPPRDWAFAAGPKGKPEAICLPGEPIIRSNLSHTTGLVVVALTRDHEIGIDVEDLGRPAPLELADKFFTPLECDRLSRLPRAEATETFLTIWTLKEAYLKATGDGLSQPLDSFAFDIDSLKIYHSPDMVDMSANWFFDRRRIGPNHLFALAMRHPAPDRLSVSLAPADLTRLANWV